jgi:hypothetical protein
MTRMIMMIMTTTTTMTRITMTITRTVGQLMTCHKEGVRGKTTFVMQTKGAGVTMWTV